MKVDTRPDLKAQRYGSGHAGASCLGESGAALAQDGTGKTRYTMGQVIKSLRPNAPRPPSTDSESYCVTVTASSARFVTQLALFSGSLPGTTPTAKKV